ncbi:MAG TPA: iron-sulfur cluster-binding domain-containing protein [Candidatus Binatia bacterium]|nr:iron-sulfur cluster-binding domain-containing protein [Candidatus Binatia bacterium]
MLQPSLSASLGCLFVVLAGANVWMMLHASSRSGDHATKARLIRAHRIGGYTFVLLFCVVFYFMALRLKGVPDELPARLTLHILLALLLPPILLVKVLIARYYKQYASALLPLGVTIFALSLALVSMNLVPYVLGRAGSGRVPTSVSVGVLLTVGIGVGLLLLRRPRLRTPSASAARPIRSMAVPEAGRPRQSIRLQLARIDPQTHDTKTLRFVLSEADRLFARPGQFLVFQWKIDGELVPRSYSISSSPAQSAYVEITSKRVPNGHVSAFLNDRAAVGLVVEAKGPFGRFYFDEVRHKRIVLIAGGSGITPIMAMLRYIDDRCLVTPVTLIYCVRTRDDIIFEQELERLRRRLPTFRMVLVLSQPDAAWNGPRGRLSRELIASSVEEPQSSTFFLCGPSPFMVSVQETLQSLDVRSECVTRESFASPRTVGGTLLGAGTAALVEGTAEFVRSGKVCGVPPGKTLLEIAEMHGVEIPSGCRQGRCGTCVTKLLEGDVKMDIEDGLGSGDKAEGCILMCVARPRGYVKVDA